MPTDFLQAAGTNGYIATPFDLLTTELNALASGAAATSSVGGTSGVFAQSNYASAIETEILFEAGGAFTPILGQCLWGWFLRSDDGGSTIEALVSTPSATVWAVSRPPDFIIALDNAAYASGNKRWCVGAKVEVPAGSHKVVLQNSGTTALPATGNKITAAPIAKQY